MKSRSHSFSMKGGVSNATLKKYNLSRERFNEMKKAQGGRCAACGLYRPLVIDHSHETNEVRALLCRVCNMLVGVVEHCPERIAQAKVYLARFN